MRRFWITSCTALLAAASASSGQTSPGDSVVDIPFAFVVTGQTLPAGHYIVAPLNDARIRVFNSATSVYVSTHAALRNSE